MNTIMERRCARTGVRAVMRRRESLLAEVLRYEGPPVPEIPRPEGHSGGGEERAEEAKEPHTSQDLGEPGNELEFILSK